MDDRVRVVSDKYNGSFIFAGYSRTPYAVLPARIRQPRQRDGSPAFMRGQGDCTVVKAYESGGTRRVGETVIMVAGNAVERDTELFTASAYSGKILVTDSGISRICYDIASENNRIERRGTVHVPDSITQTFGGYGAPFCMYVSEEKESEISLFCSCCGREGEFSYCYFPAFRSGLRGPFKDSPVKIKKERFDDTP